MPGDYEVRVTPSLLDRLLDLEPSNSRDAAVSRAESVREFKRGVQRDLESLLNSRNPHPDLPPAFAKARVSVLTYGLPDVNAGGKADLDNLRHAVEGAVRAYEPRLSHPTVVLLTTSAVKGSLSLRIDARLVIDPTPEPVSFDVVLPGQAKRSEVKESS